MTDLVQPITLGRPVAAADQRARLDAIIQAYRRRFGAEWTEQVDAMVAAVGIAQLAAWIEAGDRMAIQAQFERLLTPALDVMRATSAAALLAGGQERIRHLAQAADIVISFDLTYEPTVQAARDLGGRLIREMGEETRAGVMQSLARSVREGINPRTAARRFRSSIGLTRRQEQAVTNFQRGLETLDRSILDRALRDKRFDGTLRRALETQQPLKPQQIERMVTRYRQRSIKHRSELIARTESLRAVHVGSHQGMGQIIPHLGRGQELKRFWVYTHDGKTRDAHRRIPSLNKEGVGLDDSYQTPLGPLRFPHDPNGSAKNTVGCRCTEVARIINSSPEGR